MISLLFWTWYSDIFTWMFFCRFVESRPLRCWNIRNAHLRWRQQHIVDRFTNREDNWMSLGREQSRIRKQQLRHIFAYKKHPTIFPLFLCFATEKSKSLHLFSLCVLGFSRPLSCLSLNFASCLSAFQFQRFTLPSTFFPSSPFSSPTFLPLRRSFSLPYPFPL